MTDVRQATREVHKIVEHTPFAQMLINGELTAQQWALYLYNQHAAYSAIESRVSYDITDLPRASNILRDIAAINNPGKLVLTATTNAYVKYILSLPIELIWSHIYVRYMGDLAGGQVIKKLYNRYPHSVLEFNDNQQAIDYIRANVADANEAEAIATFTWVGKHFEELYELVTTS